MNDQMNNAPRRPNWKYIAATAAGFAAVLGAIYYVNCVYLPNRALERAMAMDAETMAAERAAEEKAQNERTYSFNINTELGQRSATSSDEGVTVTTDENGDIIVDRTWDEDTGDLPISAGPGSPITNIGGGGGEKITGEDGAYHGEQPAAQTPENGGPGSGTEADSKNDGKNDGKTDSGKTGETPSTPSTPSSGTDSKPNSGGSSTGGSSTGGNNNSGSSKPKDGDRRVVNGQEQEYWNGFGWVDRTNDIGGTDYWDVGGDSGIYVGSMG